MCSARKKPCKAPSVTSATQYTKLQRQRFLALQKAKRRIELFRLTNRTRVLVECTVNLLDWREAVGYVLDWNAGNISGVALQRKLNKYKKVPYEDLDVLLSKTFHIFAKIDKWIDADTLSQMLNCPLEQAEWAITEYKRVQ